MAVFGSFENFNRESICHQEGGYKATYSLCNNWKKVASHELLINVKLANSRSV